MGVWKGILVVSLPIGVGRVSDQWMRRAGAKEVAAMRDLRAFSAGIGWADGSRWRATQCRPQRASRNPNRGFKRSLSGDGNININT